MQPHYGSAGVSGSVSIIVLHRVSYSRLAVAWITVPRLGHGSYVGLDRLGAVIEMPAWQHL